MRSIESMMAQDTGGYKDAPSWRELDKMYREACKTIAELRAELDLVNDILKAREQCVARLEAQVAEQRKRITELEDFVINIRDNWDCDTGANEQHHDMCRECQAKAFVDGKLCHPLDPFDDPRPGVCLNCGEELDPLDGCVVCQEEEQDG